MPIEPAPDSKAHVIVQTLATKGFTVAQVAARFGVSQRWVYELARRYRLEGAQGLVFKSKRPRSNSRAISFAMRSQIIALRKQLLTQGLDAGAESIAWNLTQAHLSPPATSTIWRILRQEGLVTPEPKKRPKAYIKRFQALQPNETWQSDFTHWRLADGADVEIINWLDDHSRLLLHCSVHRAVTGKIVVDSFNQTRRQYGTPFSTLTDNGVVYTARFVLGVNAFEYLLATLGVVQKNGSPGHPQTQGKIERFHQTQKKWLAQQNPAKTLEELQEQLSCLQDIYNTKRAHKAIGMQTPLACYEATIKAVPKLDPAPEPFRVRHDVVDGYGKLTLRRAGRLHHMGVGMSHRGKAVTVIVSGKAIMVVEKATGEVLGEYDIEISRNYWANKIDLQEIRAQSEG